MLRLLANGGLEGVLGLKLLLVALETGLPIQALINIFVLLLGHDYFLAALVDLRDEVEMLVLLELPILHLMLYPLHLFLFVDCFVVEPGEDIGGGGFCFELSVDLFDVGMEGAL